MKTEPGASASQLLPPGVVHAARSMVPPIADKRFWVLQIIVVLLAAAHLLIDVYGVFLHGPFPASTTVGFMLIPVGYAAVYYGLKGSVATSIWIVILWLPDLLLPDGRGTPYADIIQLALLVGVSIFVGSHIETELAARKRAEMAEQAHAQAEHRARNFALQVLSAQEEERKRIAYELHDEPVQLLTHLAQRLDMTPEKSTGTGSPAIPSLRDVALEVLDDLRRISRGLRPTVLDELGLSAAIGSLISELEDSTGIHAKADLPAEHPKLPPETELAVFRIVQEAVNNVVHHASAKQVVVEVKVKPESILVRISDDGKGFDANASPAEGHVGLGLTGMRERAGLLGGYTEIKSSPQKGTTILTTIPLTPMSPESLPVLAHQHQDPLLQPG